MTLIQTIQERLAKICENVYGGPAHSYASENATTYRIQDAAIAKCAAAIRDADLSDLEPKGVELVERLRIWAADIPMVQDQNIPLNGPSLLKLLHEAVGTIAALTARLEAAERGANRYKIVHNGDLPGYAIMPCDDENRDVSLDGDALDEAIDVALKERK